MSVACRAVSKGRVSSYYRFLIRMGAVAANPCDALERPKVLAAPPSGLSADQVRPVAIASARAGPMEPARCFWPRSQLLQTA